jgi:hypothetical protein
VGLRDSGSRVGQQSGDKGARNLSAGGIFGTAVSLALDSQPGSSASYSVRKGQRMYRRVVIYSGSRMTILGARLTPRRGMRMR